MLNLARYAGMAALAVGVAVAATKPASAWVTRHGVTATVPTSMALPTLIRTTATIPTTTRTPMATWLPAILPHSSVPEVVIAAWQRGRRLRQAT